jgi:hypothetical protein
VTHGAVAYPNGKAAKRQNQKILDIAGPESGYREANWGAHFDTMNVEETGRCYICFGILLASS